MQVVQEAFELGWRDGVEVEGEGGVGRAWRRRRVGAALVAVAVVIIVVVPGGRRQGVLARGEREAEVGTYAAEHAPPG